MLSKKLEYFYEVAKWNSFTEASNELYISQPALSRSIKSLENQLGVPLFDRRGRTIILNEYGKILLDKVIRSMNIIHEGEVEIKELIHPFTGTIKISFIHTLGNNFVPNIIKRFRKVYPNVKFEFYQGTTDVVMEHLMSDKVDLCFLMEADFPKIVVKKTIKKEELFIVTSNSHYLSNKRQLPLNAIQQEPFVSFKKGIGLRRVTDGLCKKAGFTPKVVFEGSQVGTVNGFVAADLGVSLVPKNKGVSEFDISCIPVSFPKCYRDINIAWKKGAFIS
ncbi:MAG TPA: LysR family transcriptional regulator, partial [Pseudogracilibacillus sp.]|nr:LysR family transcriptional regulator [Pseudogracilibacillus sp.]